MIKIHQLLDCFVLLSMLLSFVAVVHFNGFVIQGILV